MEIPFDKSLGTAVPDSPHAVCVHFPTLKDVERYEEHDPRVVEALETGYPRFVVNSLIILLADHIKDKHQLDGRHIVLLNSNRGARELEDYLLTDDCEYFREGTLTVFHCGDSEEIRKATKEFVQHTGTGISSRQAEDMLVQEGVIQSAYEEQLDLHGAHEAVRIQLSQIFRTNRPDSLLLTNSGMNAFYSVFKAVNELASEEGRHIWIQIGWVYLDTGVILAKFTESEDCLKVFFSIHDLDAVALYLERYGHRVAAIFTEVPTNPLMQTIDLVRLRQLADSCGAVLVLDPTLASPYNIDVLPYADVVVNSLTKYAAQAGDVMMGAVVFNPRRREVKEIISRVVVNHEPPYARDLARMAVEIQSYPLLMKRVNQSTVQVATFLQEHPRVRRVYWAYSRGYRQEFERVARWPISPGSVISFEVDGDVRAFFDHCPLVKGPSFGTTFTILCPYLYLAHYDMVSTPAGRAELEDLGIPPGLMRLSVGMEPHVDIIAALARGLTAL